MTRFESHGGVPGFRTTATGSLSPRAGGGEQSLVAVWRPEENRAIVGRQPNTGKQTPFV